jgi:peptidoglycan hydrolase-like protein with peptidoglycan-binding domain
MAEYKILVPPPRRRRVRLVLVLVLVVAAVAVGAYVAGRHTGSGSTSAASGGSGHAATATTVGLPPLTVVSTSPASGATDVPSDQAVTVRFSAPVTGTGGLPAFVPAVAGTWTRAGPATFAATAPFIPTTTESLVIPAGAGGPRGRDGATLARPDTVTFTVAQASTERLQQLLAQLGYLPLTFTASGPLSSPVQATTAQAGAFAWKWPGLPSSLTSLWTEGAENVITKGAVMNFENQSGLTVDGLAGSQVWTALVTDAATGKDNADPYTYVFVSKQLPEALTLFENGVPTLVNIPVNTGAPGADTTDGTYPVFEHVTSSRMVGTNPDGSTYDDPAVPWASFFNGGDALHGFVRATYGAPQSNGCVEMTIADAAEVWPLTPIGTLVTVVGPVS